jgi:hypothetical protein
MIDQSTFVLRSGIEVRIRELAQTLTYEGWLEGLPIHQINGEILKRTVREAREKYKSLGSPYLIPPVENLIPHDDDPPYAFGTPATLPRVTCVARLWSSSPARDGDFSQLVVIWMQDGFAMPVAEPVLTSLLEIDWKTNATDCEW